METSQIVTLIANRISPVDIAHAAGLTVDGVLRIAEENQGNIMRIILTDLNKKIENKSVIQQVREETLVQLRNQVKYADIKECLLTLDTLDKIDPENKGFGQQEADERKEEKNVNIRIEINDVLDRRVNATFNDDGEIVAVNKRDMRPASIDQIKEIRDEYERQGENSKKHLEGDQRC